MGNLYINLMLFRSAYAEKNVFHDVARTHVQVVPEEII